MTDLNFSILVSCLLSGIIVGGIAFYFFKTHVEHLQQKSKLEIKLRYQKETLPIRLQAYERLTLLTERLSLGNLLNRLKPVGEEKQAYENLLIDTIEQEFEHNLVQQIYVSTECWNTIKTAKNATISKIRKTNMSDNIANAQKLRETLLLDLLDQKNSPNDLALQVIRKELKSLF